MTTAQQRSASQSQADYLREVCQLLWPPPALAAPGAAQRTAGGPEASELIVLPGLRRPRLVVPADRRTSSAAIRGYGSPGSARDRIAARILSAALASGLGGLVLRDRLQVRVPPDAETIETHLAAVLGYPVRVSMNLGAARANRKPVLQLLTPSGRTAGFAKIGVNPLTSELIRTEHDALVRLKAAALTRIAVPDVLASGQWQGLDVLVLSPLPVWHKRVPLRPSQLAQAMVELASVSPVSQAPLATSEYWERLVSRLESADDGSERTALHEALDQLASRAGSSRLSFGHGHGDWTPWNMASTRAGLLVWDWERFTAGTPAGFDALHYWLQAQAVADGRDPRQAAAACVEQAAALLEPFGLPPMQARLTALVYLADLSVRYLADRQEQAGARLGAPGAWLIPALQAGVSQL
jgi:hypothetical protein